MPSSMKKMILGKIAVSPLMPFSRTARMDFWISRPHQDVVIPREMEVKGVCAAAVVRVFTWYSKACIASKMSLVVFFRVSSSTR